MQGYGHRYDKVRLMLKKALYSLVALTMLASPAAAEMEISIYGGSQSSPIAGLQGT